MDTALMTAIVERVKLGHTKEQIIQELVAAGYTPDHASEVYAEYEASHNTVSSVPPAPEQFASAPTPASAHVAAATKPGKKKLLIIGMVGIFLVIATLVVLLSGFGFSTFNLFGQSAPYKTESAMLVGVIESTTNTTAFGFDVDYEILFEPRAADTPLYTNEQWDEAQSGLKQMGFGIPDEGYVKMSMSGLVDSRDKENPEFDVEASLNVLIEPFILNVGGAARLAEGSLYGKITKLPAMYETYVDGMPINEWILLTDKGLGSQNIESIIGAPELFIKHTPIEGPVLVEATMNKLQTLLRPAELIMLSQKVRQAPAAGQLASSIQAFGLDTSTMSEEDLRKIELAVELLETHPPLTFVGEPAVIERDGERLFDYQLAISYTNIRSYLMALANAMESIDGRNLEQDVEELLSQLPSQASFDQFNQLVDMYFTFRADGTLAGSRLVSSVVLSPEATSQISVRFETVMYRQNDGLDITVPADVHPQSLEEMMEEKQQQRAQEMGDVLVKQNLSNMRSHAEISYNESNFSYQNVCAVAAERLVRVANYQCKSSHDKYVIYAPLINQPEYYCIDGFGSADTYSVRPDIENNLQCNPG